MLELGVLIGHYTDREGGTGCTVVLCPEGGTPGVMVRGGAPCTRETDIFRPGAGVDPRRAHSGDRARRYPRECSGWSPRGARGRGVSREKYP